MKASAGAYAQMFQISQEDTTTFNEWEQALTALLQYEFKCSKQAEWQLFGDDTGLLQRPTWTGNGTDAEKAVLNKLANLQMAAIGVYERAKLTKRQEETFEDEEVQQQEWDRVNDRLYTLLMTYTTGTLNQTIMTAKRQGVSAGDQYATIKTVFEESSSVYRTGMISQIASCDLRLPGQEDPVKGLQLDPATGKVERFATFWSRLETAIVTVGRMGTAAQREEVESKFTHKEVLNIYKLMIQNGPGKRAWGNCARYTTKQELWEDKTFDNDEDKLKGLKELTALADKEMRDGNDALDKCASAMLGNSQVSFLT